MAIAALLVPAGTAASPANFAAYGEIPPPQLDATGSGEDRLMLELVVNGLGTGVVASVLKRQTRFHLAVADLQRAGLLVNHPATSLFLDEMPGVTASYDAPVQQLHLVVAPDYLPAQHLGGSKRPFEPVQYAMGGLLNYDLYMSGGGGKPHASLYHEARFFGPAGVFSTTGALRSGRGKAYIRFDTVWRRSDSLAMTTIEVGDFVTRGLPWASAVRLGGIQLSRDFSVRPDIVTYPLPEFSGSAALPSTVDLIVDGQRIGGGAVNPGPFAIGSLPQINGAGEANLIVTDMHGRSIAASMPFYVSSHLLRPGLTDFAFAFGSLREGYGIKDFGYGRFVGSASARHGVTPGITLEVRAEIAEDMQLAGGGAIVKLGIAGVLSGSYSRNLGETDAGEQLTLGYEYQSRLVSVALRHSWRDAGYADLGSINLVHRWDARRISSATTSLSLGRGGTLGVGYFDIASGRGADARLANAVWTLPLWGGSRLNASATREFQTKNWSGAISVSILLGRRQGNMSAGFVDTQGGARVWRADYARPAPAEGGLGWSASAARANGGDLYLRGDMSLRTDHILLRGGAYRLDGIAGWFGASGALVVLDGGIFAANRIADAFAIVNTGEPDIPVRYENQLVGRTNGNGQLLVPWASAFYPAKYEIDPLSLRANVRVPIVSQRVAVARGSGLVVHFPVERMTAARAIVTDRTGMPLPPGAIVRIDGEIVTHLGWDGLLFLENIGADNRFTIELPNGSRCNITFASAPDRNDIVDLGELICAPITG